MARRIVPWVDPITNEKLIEKDNYLMSKSSKYPIVDGIPNFVGPLDFEEKQVSNAFGYKWTRSKFGQDDHEFDSKLKKYMLEFMGLKEEDLLIFKDKVILDVGIGSGSSARLWASHAKEFHGVDISKAIFKAKNALKTSIQNPILSRTDLNFLPYPNESFDIIVSNGVFHHTRNTKLAIGNVVKKIKRNGLLLFYIYKKKSPLREFSDDYIRSKISDLPYDEAWEEMKSITYFGKWLNEKSITIDVPADLKILDIKKGKHDLQRFVYKYFFKCFWNETWGFDYSNLVNFDWYYPKFAWRHSKEEIIDWCNEFNLDIQYLKEIESGYTCLAIRTK